MNWGISRARVKILQWETNDWFVAGNTRLDDGTRCFEGWAVAQT